MALPARQQTRPLTTILKPKESTVPHDVFFKHFTDIHREHHPELDGARFLGLHCTTALQMDSIIENGFDPERSGQNWKTATGEPYSKDGKGCYVTDKAESGINYGINALATQGGSDPEYRMQMIALYEKDIPQPDGTAAAPCAAEQHVVTVFDDQSRETMIPPSALNGPNKSYIAVPLPAFGPQDIPDVQHWLEQANLGKP